MSTALAELLEREPFAILDGGLATELERDGHDLDDPLWSAKLLLDDPASVAAVHRRYAEAGADIITTASYQATLPGLCARGLEEAGFPLRLRPWDDEHGSSSPNLGEAGARALLRESVALARRAAGGRMIAASIGSYGAYLADGSEYRGDYGLDRSALVEFHRERLRELSAAGPDLLAFETIPSAIEVAAIAELLDAEAGPPAWVSFSLRPDLGTRLADGTALVEAVVPMLGHSRVAAIGVNCLGPSEVLPALERLATLTATPLIAYPNSGERWHERSWCGTASEPARFVGLALRWHEAGARIIGGCCRTGPAHTAALVALRGRIRGRLT